MSKVHPSASLYIGDLSTDVTEGNLFEIFNSVGPVASIRVCRDTLTHRSLGYAYVNFHSVVDAERALDTLNNTLIKGKPCRIMWSQRDPTIRRSGVGNIFIKNLDPAITHKELFDTFSAFGNILSCKVAMDGGQSKGFGFVHFENAESAENAVKMVDGMLLGSKKVYVARFVPKRDWMRQKESSWTNVYVKDLDSELSDAELLAKFAEHGTVQNCKIMRKEDGSSCGFGFVNFDKHEDAVKAVEALHGIDLKGKKLWCGRAQKKTEREQELKKKFNQLKMERLTKYQGINLYVKNLEDEIDEERLRKEFEVFGNVKSAKIMMYDEKGNSKGFGFICFSTPEEAQRAINEMNGRILQGCTKPLYVALHEPKDIRRTKLAQRYAARLKNQYGANTPQGAVYPGNQMFYPNAPPSGYVYPPQQIMPQRGASWGPSVQPQYQQPMAPQYMMSMPPPGGRGGRGGQSGGGRGGRGGNRRAAAGHQAGGSSSGHQQVSPVPVPMAADNHPVQQQLADVGLQQLSQFPVDQQKLFLGERLYPLIHKVQPQLAGKITGMLLDSGWGIEDLYALLNDEEKLNSKIDEAVRVLHNTRVPQLEGEAQSAPEVTQQ